MNRMSTYNLFQAVLGALRLDKTPLSILLIVLMNLVRLRKTALRIFA